MNDVSPSLARALNEPSWGYGVEVRRIIDELAASESLVTALQEQMSRLAEQHAKAVAEAREEQREQDAQRGEKVKYALTGGPDSLSGAFNAGVDAAVDLIRGAPLDSTPLAARIAELEAEQSRSDQAAIRFARESSVALAAEVERHQATAKVLEVQIGAWESLLVGGMHPAIKVFAATQVKVIRETLASLPAGPREVR